MVLRLYAIPCEMYFKELEYMDLPFDNALVTHLAPVTRATRLFQRSILLTTDQSEQSVQVFSCFRLKMPA